MGLHERSPTTALTEQQINPVHYAKDLTQGGDLAHIQLYDQVYTLRITRAGKLILTK